MKIRMFAFALLAISMTAAVQAGEYKVSGVHNCCGSCTKGITKALEGVEGVSDIVATPKETTISFTATDNKVARKALVALGRAGFHGKVEGGGKLQFPPNSGVKDAKIDRLELVGVHNCCPGCAKAIEDLVSKVDGVKGQTLAKSGKSVVVEGDFNGLAVVKALNEGGFHVRQKGAATGAKKKKKPADK